MSLPVEDETYLLSLAARSRDLRGFVAIVQEEDGGFTWHISGQLVRNDNEDHDLDTIKLIGTMEALKATMLKNMVGIEELDPHGRPWEGPRRQDSGRGEGDGDDD